MMRTGGVRILLIEDSEDDVLVVRRVFEKLRLPHELIVQQSGEDALDYLAKASPGPALILLDLNLPGLSGLEVLRRLRQEGRLAPVTILSASARDADVTEAYRLGANHYLVKPLEFEPFAALIKRWSEYWLSGRLPR
jgi:two-component system, response regulator